MIKTKIIFFDIDGTLINYDGCGKIFLSAIENFLRTKIDWQWDRYSHYTDFGTLNHIYRDTIGTTPSKNDLISIISQYKNLLMSRQEKIIEIEGAKDIIANLQSKTEWIPIIITGNWKIIAIEKLKMALINYNSTKLYACENYSLKSEIVALTLMKYRKKYKHIKVISVGDTIGDYEAALKNNIEFIARREHYDKYWIDLLGENMTTSHFCPFDSFVEMINYAIR